MCSAHSSTRRVRGFTLIEMLVVVSIIALLMAILLPALARARAHARNAKCLSNLDECGAAMYQHAAEHQEVIPRGGDSDTLHWSMVVARKLGLVKSLPTGFKVNELRVDKMETFHCPERMGLLKSPWIDYVCNAMDPEGPRREGGCQDQSDCTLPPPDAVCGTWQQVRHDLSATRPLSRLSVYKRPSEVIYLCDAAREDRVLPFAGNPSVKEAHEHWLDPAQWGLGGIDVMDVWRGAHVPEGKPVSGGASSGPYNTNDGTGYRRAARTMHLDRFTNAGFMDGHAQGVPLANRTLVAHPDEPDHVANYAHWLRLFGVREAQRIAMEDPDLR